MASISSSHIIDLASDDNMSSSVEYQRFSTLGRKRNSIDRHSAAMFGAEDEVRIMHAIVCSVLGLSFHLNSIQSCRFCCIDLYCIIDVGLRL